MLFLRVFKHVLPKGKAWQITIDKILRQFFTGLSAGFADIREYFDLIWLDIFPATTRALSEWEDQFGLPNSDISEAERRTRLDATWKALGGQSPRYIQDVLQDNGFNVYVHEWWEPGTEPPIGTINQITPRDPNLIVNRDVPGIMDQGAESGILDDGATEGIEVGDGINAADVPGYPLVNKIPLNFSALGVTDDGANVGILDEGADEVIEDNAGISIFSTDYILKEYTVPTDPQYWPYFIYIGGEVYGDSADVPTERREELERLCLKICPLEQWIIMIINYT